ncbi:MAG: undecaprenyldiphospho-muramoylpentapeptide beta-N-acetylglucosaminyltransferase [Bacilli bacterium]
MKIVLTGGGTLGHVTPHFAIIPYLNKCDLYYIGSIDGIEKEYIKSKNIKYYEISSGKLRRYFSLKNFTDPFRVIKGFFDAKKHLKNIKPDVIFSKGGFVSVPVVLAASQLKIPVIIHESDITVGLANRIASKYANTVCTSFNEAASQIKGEKSIVTGSPIREEIKTGNEKRAMEFCGFKKKRKTILIMGGSLGAQKVNEIVRDSLDILLQDYNIIHLCGKGKTDGSINKEGYVQFEFVGDELKDLFKITDIIISRAGSNSIFEFAYLNIPHILIPLPSKNSRGDQLLNAKSFEKIGFSKVLLQENLNSIILCKQVKELDKNREIYINNMKKSNKINGSKKIAELINKFDVK